VLGSNDREINVYLRSGPPGTCKTSEKVNELKKTKFRKIILGPGHDYLSEQEAWIPNSKHWWGLASKYGCPCLRETEDSKIPEKEAKRKLIQRFVNLKFTYDHVCSTCKDIEAYSQENCPYKKQFNNIKSFPFVLAPIAYAFTKRIEDYDPQEIVVDDCILNAKLLPKKSYLELQLQRLMNFTDTHSFIDSKLTLEKLNNNPDYNNIIRKLKGAYKKNIKKLVEEAKDKNWKEIISSYDKNFLVSPNDIDTYCKLARVHEYQEQFATPAVFYLFDYVVEKQKEGKKIKLTIIDARPDMNFLKSLADRYYKEKHVVINFKDDNFKPKMVDQGSVVYDMTGPFSWYPKYAVENFETQKRFKRKIEWILVNRYNNDSNLKIGIIFWKPKGKKETKNYEKRLHEKMRRFIPERFKKVEIETRGNTRGKNSLENCDVLFIIGSPVINKYKIEPQYVHWHGHKPSTLETVEKGPHGGRYHFVDQELETFCRLREEEEMYQEIHRARPWLKKKHIYVLGKVPKSISEEGIEVRKLDGEDIRSLGRKEWLEEYVKHKSPVPRIFVEEAVAKQFGISEKWAYREIKKVVAESDHLRIKKGGIFYE